MFFAQQKLFLFAFVQLQKKTKFRIPLLSNCIFWIQQFSPQPCFATFGSKGHHVVARSPGDGPVNEEHQAGERQTQHAQGFGLDIFLFCLAWLD